jgi:hypothetical protein
LTQTLSPSLTTSVVLATRSSASWRDVDEAVLGAEEVHEGAEVGGLDDGAFVDFADFRLGTIDLIHLMAASISCRPTRRS